MYKAVLFLFFTYTMNQTVITYEVYSLRHDADSIRQFEVEFING